MHDLGDQGRENESRAVTQTGTMLVLPSKRTEPDFVRELFRDSAPYCDMVNQIFSLGSAGFAQVVCEGWFDLFRSYAGQKSEA